MNTKGQPFCSDISIQADESLAGTATETEVFLLLECDEAWGEKAVDESQIPAELKSRLKNYQKSNPLAKVLLIRSTRSQIQPGFRFIVARVAAGEAAIYEFYVAAYEDLLELDIPAIVAGDPVYTRNRSATRLFLVCTNGKRDRCCARYGVQVFNALLEATQSDPDWVAWQCSHIGGHRFAANLIALPSGMLYGRVRPEDVPAIRAAESEGRIYLPKLRGRMVFSQPAQAAEAALRRELDEPRLNSIRLARIESLGPDSWLAAFDLEGGGHYQVRVLAQDTGRQVFESCQLDKPTPVKEYEFEIEELSG